MAVKKKFIPKVVAALLLVGVLGTLALVGVVFWSKSKGMYPVSGTRSCDPETFTDGRVPEGCEHASPSTNSK